MLDFPVYSLDVFGLRLYGFGLAVALAALLAWLLLHLGEKRYALPAGSARLLIVLALPISLLLSRALYSLILRERLFYDVMDGSYLGLRPFLDLAGGGLSFFGMLMGIVLAALLAARLLRRPGAQMLDWVALPLVVFISIARFGEILGGQGFGEELSLPALQFFPLGFRNSYEEWYLAVCVLEGLAAALIALSLLRSRGEQARPGDRMIRMLIPFAAMQVFLESLRQDAYLRLESNAFIRVEQVLAMLVLVILLSLLSRPALRAGHGRLLLVAWLSLLLAAGAALAAEFNEKLPLPKALLYALSLLAQCLHIWIALRLLRRTRRPDNAITAA